VSLTLSFDIGGHGLLPQMGAVRQEINEFLKRGRYSERQAEGTIITNINHD
jgi:hypothetical protein